MKHAWLLIVLCVVCATCVAQSVVNFHDCETHACTFPPSDHIFPIAGQDHLCEFTVTVGNFQQSNVDYCPWYKPTIREEIVAEYGFADDATIPYWCCYRAYGDGLSFGAWVGVTESDWREAMSKIESLQFKVWALQDLVHRMESAPRIKFGPSPEIMDCMSSGGCITPTPAPNPIIRTYMLPGECETTKP